MKTIQQKIIKYLLFILVLGLFTNGCSSCPTSTYTDEIKTILDPVSQTLEDFYTTHQRMPNTSERNKILEDRGCLFGDKGEGYCKKFGVWFKVYNDSTSNPPSDYSLNLEHGDVFCSSNISSYGTKGKYPLAFCSSTCGGWQ